MDSYLLGRVGDHQSLVVSENWWFAGCPGEAIQDHRKPLTTTRTKTTLVPDDNPSFWGPRFSSRSHKIFKVSNFHFFSFIVFGVSFVPTGLPFEFYLDSKTKNKSRGFFTMCKITERLFGSTDSAVLRVGALRSSSRDTLNLRCGAPCSGLPMTILLSSVSSTLNSKSFDFGVRE